MSYDLIEILKNVNIFEKNKAVTLWHILPYQSESRQEREATLKMV